MPQKVPRQRRFIPAQQSLLVVHLSFNFEQRGTGAPQIPSVQRPVQQSVPSVHEVPSFTQGSRAAQARWLPVSSSWPGR